MSETSFSMDERDVDHGSEYFNVTVTSAFDAPPAVLLPGASHPLAVAFSHSGTVVQGNPGAIFQYGADSGHSSIITPFEVLGYAPWAPTFGGVASKTWTLKVPQGRKGDTLQVSAFWWNAAGCDVTWTYRAR